MFFSRFPSFVIFVLLRWFPRLVSLVQVQERERNFPALRLVKSALYDTMLLSFRFLFRLHILSYFSQSHSTFVLVQAHVRRRQRVCNSRTLRPQHVCHMSFCPLIASHLLHARCRPCAHPFGCHYNCRLCRLETRSKPSLSNLFQQMFIIVLKPK